MRIFFVLGTAAELIKMYPLLREVSRLKMDWYVWNTGQSRDNFWIQYDDFGFPRERSFCLDDQAQDLNSRRTAARWFFRSFFSRRQQLQKEIQARLGFSPAPLDLCFVHGDTLSTVIGCLYGRKFKMQIAHVEAGMRSGHLFEPFPEEINRRIASHFADFHFAPDENAANNLKRERQRGQIVVTGGNSVMDALRFALESPRPLGLPAPPYAVANLHRFENLHNDHKWQAMIEALCQASKKIPIHFVMHPPTKARLNADPQAQKLLREHQVHLLDRMTYLKYVHLMSGAQYLLTDSGSNQQESSYLGTPCLLLRERTESLEGLGRNCVLSEYKPEVIANFIENPLRFRCPTAFPVQGPTQSILHALDLKN